MAEADAEAYRIREMSKAKVDIEVEQLRQRAADRFLTEEMAKQENMESITKKAIPHLSDDASPNDIEDDWITSFFDKCRITSDKQMQDLWAAILAGEANNPGSFSRKTVYIVADLDQRAAGLFVSLCRFVWVVHQNVGPLIFDVQHDIYNRCGVNFGSLRQLEALGLARYDDLSGFVILDLPERVTAYYGDRPFLLTLPGESNRKLDIGKVLFTQYGAELFKVVRAPVVEGLFDYVRGIWAPDSFKPQD